MYSPKNLNQKTLRVVSEGSLVIGMSDKVDLKLIN